MCLSHLLHQSDDLETCWQVPAIHASLLFVTSQAHLGQTGRRCGQQSGETTIMRASSGMRPRALSCASLCRWACSCMLAPPCS